ncbi:hypothetical protein LDENG_00179480 [Lucifuga dentata]|nr:hypothetical protein LDENG_00179480 [Lucifuga dentata]
MEMLIHAISSRLDYCNALFTCLNKASLNCLQMVQNTAARLLTRSKRRTHITPILSLHWLPINFRFHCHRLLRVPHTHFKTRGD